MQQLEQKDAQLGDLDKLVKELRRALQGQQEKADELSAQKSENELKIQRDTETLAVSSVTESDGRERPCAICVWLCVEESEWFVCVFANTLRERAFTTKSERN